MEQVTYQPSPIDVSEVKLPVELEPLLEQLAENIHDVWSVGRMNQGWTYGPKRDDVTKTHPCLVPYGELPESEKEYDRSTGESALKAIIALGYTILPPGSRE